jgi:regulator of RNase E activity RraA
MAIKKRRKRGSPMKKITYEELFKDKRMRFAISIVNSAYASDSLDRLRIQKPGSDHYYFPLEIHYLAGAEADSLHRVFGIVHTADFCLVRDPDSPAYQANPYEGEIAFIRTLQPGDVAVINTPASDEFSTFEDNEKKCGGVWGGLLTALSLSYGAMGAVVNGPIRDTNQINSYFKDESFDPRSLRSLEKALGKKASKANIRKIRTAFLKREKFPVYGTGTLPTDSAFRTEAFSVGEPIKIGNVMIHDRDFIIADNDGQVVIPNETIHDVLEEVIEIDAGDKDVWADALTRLAGFHSDSIDEIVARHGGHL